MDLFKAKDIAILLVGVIFSIILALFPYSLFTFYDFKTVYLTIVFIFFILFILILITQKKISEIEDNLIEKQVEQNRLNEKLKIHEQLIDIKADLKKLKGVLNE